MIEIKNEYIVCIDVDQTLVMHVNNDNYNYVVKNPYSGSSITFNPNSNHIELLKQYKGRDLFVIVWSAAGVLWAKAVLESLELTDYVDLIMTKPSKLVDDLPLEDIFPKPVYLK